MAKKVKKSVGKPRKKFTPSQIKQMEGYAYAGCKNSTIATLMGFDRCLIDQRADIKNILTKKRAERKLWLRKLQDVRAEADGSSAMVIFLGKNELGQTDKQETEHTLSRETIELLELIDGSTKGKLPTRQEVGDAGE